MQFLIPVNASFLMPSVSAAIFNIRLLCQFTSVLLSRKKRLAFNHQLSCHLTLSHNHFHFPTVPALGKECFMELSLGVQDQFDCGVSPLSLSGAVQAMRSRRSISRSRASANKRWSHTSFTVRFLSLVVTSDAIATWRKASEIQLTLWVILLYNDEQMMKMINKRHQRPHLLLCYSLQRS